MRIMTTNIWGDYFNNPVNMREKDILRIYDTYTPDVIGLQEITPAWYASGLFPALHKEYHLIGTELIDGDGNYVPMAVKRTFTLLAKGYEPLAETPDLSKSITWAVIKGEDGRILAVCNTHFMWRRGEEFDAIRAKNATQLHALMSYLAARFSCPVFAFGDMNCVRESPAFEVFAAHGVRHLFDLAETRDDTCSLHGDPVRGEDDRYHGKRTEKDASASIDHIVALGDGFRVLSYRVVEDGYALDATDHSPVYADVEL